MNAPAGNHPSGNIPGSVVAAVTVLILAVLAAVVFLTAAGKEVSNVILVLSSLIAPTIASFIAIGKLSDVQKKVDGKIDNLITDKSHLEQQAVAAGLIPVTAKMSFDPDSTGPMPRIRTDTEPTGYPEVKRQVRASDIIKREGFDDG